jgi:CYTH domain-containing protein
VAVEIERKFLVERVPEDVSTWPGDRIEQGYVAVAEDVEVRLRRWGGRCLETVKRGSGLRRIELEIELDPTQLEALWPATDGRRVVKTRRLGTVGGVQVELDVFENGLAGLVVAEVEFESLDAARAFRPPAWFGPEVTDDPRYANRSLALRGRPE